MIVKCTDIKCTMQRVLVNLHTNLNTTSITIQNCSLVAPSMNPLPFLLAITVLISFTSKQNASANTLVLVQ